MRVIIWSLHVFSIMHFKGAKFSCDLQKSNFGIIDHQNIWISLSSNQMKNILRYHANVTVSLRSLNLVPCVWDWYCYCSYCLWVWNLNSVNIDHGYSGSTCNPKVVALPGQFVAHNMEDESRLVRYVTQSSVLCLCTLNCGFLKRDHGGRGGAELFYCIILCHFM